MYVNKANTARTHARSNNRSNNATLGVATVTGSPGTTAGQLSNAAETEEGVRQRWFSKGCPFLTYGF